MTTPGDPGQRPWEKQPPSGGYEPPPIEYGQPGPVPSYPPPSAYPPPPGSYPPSPYPPQPGGYPPPPYQPSYPAPPQSHTNGLAIGSLVASLLAIPLNFLCYSGIFAAIVGIVLGIVAVNQIKQSGENGRGLAIAGIVVGAVILVLTMVVLIAAGIYAVNNS